MNEKNYQKSIIMKYLGGLGFYIGVLIAAEVLGYLVLRQRVWQKTDSVWVLLHWLHDNVIWVTVVLCLLGGIVSASLCIGEMLHYLNEVAWASEQVIQEMERPVVLSASIKVIQDRLNVLREQALRKDYLAREAEQRKNDLIVYLAHDLKTPLTSVIGYLSLLSEEPDLSREQRSRYTGIALDKAEHLEMLINDFFEITRFNLTVMTLEKETINLSLMLAQIASEFEPIFAEKDLVCRTDLEPEVYVFCDTGKWERVVDNLLRNAVNYSYSGSEVTVKLQTSGDIAVMQVINHGRTIPKEKLEHIFEKFFRLDSSRSAATGGAGLGLAIAKEIVTLHGGMIEVRSEQEVTVFTLKLPK